ncbi:MAG: xylulokinase [Eubacteriales bacterium]|nr:xylulokinase [Eubacteriales bacterium]
MGYLLGIDLGTSSVKALITDAKGTAKGLGQVGYEILTPQMGYAEQDPHVWWSSTIQAVREALHVSGISGNEIDGIGFSGQMHGMVALDKDKKPVGMAVIHLDQRSLREKKQIFDVAEGLLSLELLNQPSAGMMICSLLWMKHEKPKMYDRVEAVMSPKDYIRYKITGIVGTDYSDASATLAFSVKNRCWCKELIRRLELKEDIWPPVYESCQEAGTVSREAARELGISPGTKVVAGGGDCAAQLIGNAVIDEGIVSCNIGTASQLAVVTGSPAFDKEMRCQLWCHSIPGLWIFQGGALNGGNTLSWLKNKVLRDERPFAELDREALDVAAGSEGLIFLPYIAGERTPYNNPKARGVFFGLGLKHGQAHMVRAAMEGVMYNLRLCKNIFDEMGISRKKLISSGGAAKGRCWKQIQADMIDMPVYTTLVQEEACMGAAIMASVGIGNYPDVYSACKETVALSTEVTEPVEENVRRYEEQQEIFCELYKGVERFFSRL